MVPEAGTSIGQYMYLDEDCLQDIVIIIARSKLIMISGFTYSPVVSVKLDALEGYVMPEQNYPNPTRQETTIKFTLPGALK